MRKNLKEYESGLETFDFLSNVSSLISGTRVPPGKNCFCGPCLPHFDAGRHGAKDVDDVLQGQDFFSGLV